MLVASKCLHKVVVEEYGEVLRENVSFLDFLLTLLPNFDVYRCLNCNSNGFSCNGRFFEYHLNPDDFIFDLERMRLGFYEDFSYGPTGMTRRGGLGYDEYSGQSIDLTKSVPIDLELLTGNLKIDRFLVFDAQGNREGHLRDYFSVEEEFNEDLRVDLDS